MFIYEKSLFVILTIVCTMIFFNDKLIYMVNSWLQQLCLEMPWVSIKYREPFFKRHERFLSCLCESYNLLKTTLITKSALPLTRPETADCAFSLIPISVAMDPEITASGPLIPAPVMKRKIQLYTTPNRLVSWNIHRESADINNKTNTPVYVFPRMILERY